MILNYFKLIWRSLLRNKTFSTINIAGLTVGLASCIMIGLYVYYELSFDHFHHDHSRIFRVNKFTNEKSATPQSDGVTPGQLAPAIEKDFAEVSIATRFRPWFNEMLVSHDSTRLKLDDVIYADASFLTLFNFPLTNGDANTALSEPYSAVVTESTAAKYFKNVNPVGQTLITLNNIPVKISGIAKDPPGNSSIQFTLLISWATISSPANKDYFSWMDNLTTMVNFTFLKLKEGADPATVGTKISDMMHRYREDDEFQYRPYLQPLDEIHLKSAAIKYAGTFRTNSSNIIVTLIIISIFILTIACFNFINLTTAGAIARAKETGIQKVLGAGKSHLVLKFFGESIVFCTISFVLSLSVVSLLLPYFNSLADTTLDTSMFLKGKIITGFICLLALISLIAGLYPAFFMAGFKSTDVFRNAIKAGKSSWLRKLLVTSQFALSVLLITGTIVVNRQMQYISSKDLGFDRDQVAVIQIANTTLEKSCRELIGAFRQFPGIISITSSNRIPGQGFTGYGIIPEGRSLDEHLLASVLETDADFLTTYNIQLSQGRYFSPQLPTDTTESIVINEAMAKYIGWDNSVGRQLEIHEARKGKIIGVMKDFNFASLKENVQPLAVILTNNPLYLSVKLKAGNIQSSLDFMQEQWKIFDAEYPFDYFFLDEQLNKYYQSDVKLLRVLGIFAGIAISIACMGLFGLSIYTARLRIKEIGIRKVLGASVGGIVKLLSFDFLKLVFAAIIIASPIAWFTMNIWLQEFAYHIDISWWMFVVSGLLAVLIAFATVGFKSVKAARANPVRSLRSE